MDVVIVRYGELGLKGRLRKKFENVLVDNIKRVMKYEGLEGTIEREWGRIFIKPGSKDVAKRIAKVFGVVSTSVAARCEAEIDEIAKFAVKAAEGLRGSFAIRARRAGTHSFTSMDVARIAGNAVKEATGARVDLDNPDVEIFIEVREKYAYVYTEVFRGYGGLPVGTQERVLAIGKLAAWYALRRGCDVDVDSWEVKKAVEGYACYRPVGVVGLEGSLEDVLLSAFEMDYPAIFCQVTASEIPNYLEVLKKRRMPVFMPLLPFSHREIEAKLEELFP